MEILIVSVASLFAGLAVGTYFGHQLGYLKCSQDRLDYMQKKYYPNKEEYD